MKAKVNPRVDKILYQDLSANMAKAMEKHPFEDWPVDSCFSSMVDAAYDTVKDMLDSVKKSLNTST